jgi:hypothetical protein
MVGMTCGVCTAETPTGYTLCERDAGNLERHLAELDNTIAELRTTMARQGVGGPSNGSAGSTSPQPAMNLDAFDAYEQLREVTVGWAVALQGRAFYWVAKTEEAASYLLTNLDLVRRQDWAPDLATELAAAVRGAVQATDRAADKISLGRCQTTIDGIRCPDTVTAIAGHAHGRCRTCGTTVDVKEYQAWMISEAWHVQAPLPQVLRALKHSGHLNIPLKRVEHWVQRGKLVPVRDRLFTPAAVMAAHKNSRAGKKEAA